MVWCSFSTDPSTQAPHPCFENHYVQFAHEKMKVHGDNAALFVLIAVISTFYLSMQICQPGGGMQWNFVNLQQFAVPLAQCRLQVWLEWGWRYVLKHCVDPAMANVFLYCHKCSKHSSQTSEAIEIALERDEMHDVLSNTPKLLFFSHWGGRKQHGY